MTTRIQVIITTFIGTALLIGALSCSSRPQSAKVDGSGVVSTSAASSASEPSSIAAVEVAALSETINASPQYALNSDDLTELQNAGVLDSGDDAAIQTLIKK